MQGRKITQDQKAKFLKKLRLTGGNVSRAAAACGVSRASVYVLQQSDRAFGEAFAETLEAAIDDLEQEAIQV